MFLNDNIPKNKRKCITTDHHPAYGVPIMNLGFEKHQSYVFRFGKIVDKKIKKEFKRNNYTEEEKEKIKEYGQKFKSLFLCDDLKEFISKLNKLWIIFDDLPQFLKDFYNKKIIKNIPQFLKDF
jgi:hypothetical protein